MPYRSRVYPEHQLGVVTLFGALTGRQLVQATRALFEDEAWRPGFNALWDARHVTQMHSEPEDADRFERATEALQEQITGGRAAVVTHRPLDFPTALFLASRSRRGPDREVRVLTDMEEALRWLDVPPSLAALLSAETAT